ncbi:MAG: hypothetical protein JW982_05090 [Spirochaetes bacterium]|nr:hypothetical protein [Spirochaetota bacterium]
MKFHKIKIILIFILIIIAIQSCQLSDVEKSKDSTENSDVTVIPVISSTLKIWTVGDSITLGTNNGYRNRIWTALTEAGNTIDFIGTQVHKYPKINICPDADHDGYSGNTIGDITAKIDDLYQAVNPSTPDVLLIMLGTNDLAWWVSGTDFVDNCDERMMELVDHIFEMDSEMSIIVGTIPPMSYEKIANPDIDRAVFAAQYSNAIISKVKNHNLFGTRLFIADINSALTVNDLYDGIHPTEEGYDKTGDAWVKALTVYMNANN